MNRERGWSPGEAGELGGLWPEEEGGGLEPEIDLSKGKYPSSQEAVLTVICYFLLGMTFKCN